MKLAVSGSQGILVPTEIMQKIMQACNLSSIEEIVTGGQQNSPDHSIEVWAKNNNTALRIFYADHQTYGPSATTLRNREIAEHADTALIFWDGISKGTKNLKDNLHRRKKTVHVVQCEVQQIENTKKTKFKINNIQFESINDQ